MLPINGLWEGKGTKPPLVTDSRTSASLACNYHYGAGTAKTTTLVVN